MSENKKSEETFLARVHKGWRITIYEPIRESLGLEIDDRLRVTVRKDEECQATTSATLLS